MKRSIIISIFLLMTIAVSFLLPKPSYTGLNILPELNLPTHFPGWRSKDVSKELNLRDDRYNFISDAFVRVYQNRRGEELLFLILDAGNFHNPKVCYTSSGFSVRDLGDVDFQAKDTAFKANALSMKRQEQGMEMFYWLTIDKKIVDWTGQKMLELWSSLFNQKKAGLMVRIEIPAKNRSSEEALVLGRRFINDLNNHLTTEQREYLFGQ